MLSFRPCADTAAGTRAQELGKGVFVVVGAHPDRVRQEHALGLGQSAAVNGQPVAASR